MSEDIKQPEQCSTETRWGRIILQMLAVERVYASEKELLEALEEIINCPMWVKDYSCLMKGVDVAPELVVYNASIGYLRIERAREAIRKARES